MDMCTVLTPGVTIPGVNPERLVNLVPSPHLIEVDTRVSL